MPPSALPPALRTVQPRPAATRTRARARSAVAVVSGLACTAVATGALTAPEPASAGSAAAPAQPNVVLVVADDLGWGDVSAGPTNRNSGSTFNETPVFDRLAAEGIAFDNAYTGPNCAPSRASLLTGLYPPRPTHNIYTIRSLNRGGPDTMLRGTHQGLPSGAEALPAQAETVAEVLQDSGYRTGWVGKFDVTERAEQIVTEMGFDENLGGGASGYARQYHATDGVFDPSVGEGLNAYAAPYTEEYVAHNVRPFSGEMSREEIGVLVGTEKHVTDAVTDATIDLIDRSASQPFLTVVGDYAVHSPVNANQARADLLAKYEGKAIPGVGAKTSSYAALVEGFDQGLGRIVEHLRTTADPRNPGHRLSDNTIVVVTSDNGGNPIASNGALRGNKGALREGGIRVPMVVWSDNPDLVDGGRVVSTPVHAVDFLPTLTSLAQHRWQVRTDGRDLSTLWADRSAAWKPRPLFWHHPGYVDSNGGSQKPESVIRSGPWKLVYDYETGTSDLFDLRGDLDESTDLVRRKPRIATNLAGQLQRWLDRVDAPLATIRTSDDRVRVTFQGRAYADGRVTRYRKPTRLVFRKRAELPMFVGSLTRR